MALKAVAMMEAPIVTWKAATARSLEITCQKRSQPPSAVFRMSAATGSSTISAR